MCTNAFSILVKLKTDPDCCISTILSTLKFILKLWNFTSRVVTLFFTIFKQFYSCTKLWYSNVSTVLHTFEVQAFMRYPKMCLMQLAVSRLLVTSDTPQTDRQTLLCGRPHVVLKVKVSLSLPGRAGLGARRWRSPTCCQLAYRPTHSVKAGSLHRLVSSLLYRLYLIHSVLSSIICLWTNILLDLDTLNLYHF